MESFLNPAVQSSDCKHCSSPVPKDRRLNGFCCHGCETVYQILTTAGLGNYYAMKEQGVCFKPAQPASWSSREFHFQVTDPWVKFYLEGVHCSACLWLLEKLPQVMPHAVRSCLLNLNRSVLTVELVNIAFVNDVAKMIHDWGYVPHLISDADEATQKIETENRKRLLDLGLSGAIAGNVMLMSIPLYSGVSGRFETLFEVISFALSIPALFYSGRVFFKNVYSGFKSKTFPIDAPILLALLVAFFYSTVSLIRGTHQLYFDSLTALIFLLLASRYYLARLRQSSRLNLGVLDYFQSEFDGKPGDLILLRKGQKIHFDGVVRKGEGWSDHSHFTGESDPVLLQVGDPVYAGTTFLDADGEIWVEVREIGKGTRLAKLLDKVADIQSRRTITELKSDQWAQRLLMIVSTIAIIAMIYFVSIGQAEEGIRRVLALLIVTCPCALALATPLVFSLAMKSLLKKGLLVKDPAGIDQMPDVKEIYFDKTGTLTEGRLSALVDLKALSSIDASALYSLVRLSRHPVARSVERAFAEQGVMASVMEWQDFAEKPGLGLSAVDPRSRNCFDFIRADQSWSGWTESVFLKNGLEIARIAFEDEIRESTLPVISILKKSGFRLHVLSGDQVTAVSKMAASAGLDSWFSGQSPEQKSDRISNAMMIGDGVNDALALSTAKVSIAVQGGMEAAIQSAQVYSLKPGIALVPEFLKMAARVRSTLKQNFALSTSYNLVGAILSLTGHMNPLIAAILMPASALTVFWSSVARLKERE
jgi:cation transport ATPase